MNQNGEASETETLKQLLEIMHEHDLDALKVKVGDKIFELVRREGGISVLPFAGAGAVIPAAQPAPAAAAGGGAPAAPANAKKVTAPLVGVFYSSPAPDAEPFV